MIISTSNGKISFANKPLSSKEFLISLAAFSAFLPCNFLYFFNTSFTSASASAGLYLGKNWAALSSATTTF